MRPANDHLTDDELDALLGTGAEAYGDAREHLSACESCRALLARTRMLYAELGRLPPEAALGEARLAAQRRAIERRLAIPPHEVDGRSRTGIRAALLAAVAAVLLIVGVGLGRWSAGDERTAPSTSTAPANPVLAVQHAGSAYIAALVRLDVAAEVDDSLRAVGREVALSTLYGAAAEAARLEPDDPASIGLVDAARSAREGVIASRAAVTPTRSF